MSFFDGLKKRKKTSNVEHKEFSLDANRMVGRLKLALEEMWVLTYLSCCEIGALEMWDIFKEKGGEAMGIAYPTIQLYELELGGYIQRIPHNDTKGRRFRVTDKGMQYLSELREKYEWFLEKNNEILQFAVHCNPRFPSCQKD